MKDLKEYQEKAHQSVDKLFIEIDHFIKKGEQANTETKNKIHEKIAALNAKRETLKNKYQNLSNATDHASEDLKKGFEDAKDSLETAWGKVKSEFAS